MCGYREGTQDNWLITQYIRRLVGQARRFRLSSVTVLLEIDLPGSQSAGDERLFTTHIYEVLTDRYPWLAMHTDKYRLLTREVTTGLRGKIKRTFHVNFTSNHNGFYLAVRDRTTCFTIQRLIVYYTICHKGTHDFTMTPETISPKIVSDVECVEGASPENGVKATVRCLKTGNWSSLPGAGCQCNDGTRPSKDKRSCVQDPDCLPGEYLSVANAECRVCPGNSESTVSGLTVCPCVDGYYRAEGEEAKACTSKYIIH